MKKLILLLLLPIFLLSCSDHDSDSDADTKQCWVFETTTVTTKKTPIGTTTLKPTYSTFEQCNITSSEADAYIDPPVSYTTSYNALDGFYSITVTSTMAKYKKSEYKSH